MAILRKFASLWKSSLRSNVDIANANPVNQASPSLEQKGSLSSRGGQRSEVVTSRAATSNSPRATRPTSSIGFSSPSSAAKPSSRATRPTSSIGILSPSSAAKPNSRATRPTSSIGLSSPSSIANPSDSTSPSSSAAKKSWRNSVIAARKALPQDALNAVARIPSDSSVSGRLSVAGYRQSLRQLAAKLPAQQKKDAYDHRRATIVNPVSFSTSVGIEGAVQSENYYQQSVGGLRKQEQAKRLMEAMSRKAADPVSDAAEKHVFFQNHILQKRKEQDAERRRETIDAMVHASLPANVTMFLRPAPAVDMRQPSKSRRRHQPLIVPGANYIPDEMFDSS